MEWLEVLLWKKQIFEPWGQRIPDPIAWKSLVKSQVFHRLPGKLMAFIFFYSWELIRTKNADLIIIDYIPSDRICIHSFFFVFVCHLNGYANSHSSGEGLFYSSSSRLLAFSLLLSRYSLPVSGMGGVSPSVLAAWLLSAPASGLLSTASHL